MGPISSVGGAVCTSASTSREEGGPAQSGLLLDQIRQAIEDGVPQGMVLADAGYGNDTAFRSGLTDLELD